MAYITLQHKHPVRIISAHLAQKRPESAHTRVRSLALAARVAVVDKPPLEQRLDRRHNHLVHQTIAHPRFVDLARLGITNLKRRIPAMRVSAGHELVLQFTQVGLQVLLISLDVCPSFFTARKLLPRRPECYSRTDISYIIYRIP